MTDIQKVLIEEHLYLVPCILSDCFIYSKFMYEEAYQEGCLALCYAAIKYNGIAKFTTFARKVIRNKLYSYFSKENVRQKYFSALDIETLSLAYEQNNELDIIYFLEQKRKEYSGVISKGFQALILKYAGLKNKEIGLLYNVGSNQVGAWISRVYNILKKNNEFLNIIL